MRARLGDAVGAVETAGAPHVAPHRAAAVRSRAPGACALFPSAHAALLAVAAASAAVTRCGDAVAIARRAAPLVLAGCGASAIGVVHREASAVLQRAPPAAATAGGGRTTRLGDRARPLRRDTSTRLAAAARALAVLIRSRHALTTARPTAPIAFAGVSRRAEAVGVDHARTFDLVAGAQLFASRRAFTIERTAGPATLATLAALAVRSAAGRFGAGR